MGASVKKKLQASYTTTRISKLQTSEQFCVQVFLFCKFTFCYVVCASHLSWNLNYFKNLQNKGLRDVLMFKDNGCFVCGVIVLPNAQHAIHLNYIVFGIQLSLFYHSAMIQSLLLAIINIPNDLRSIFQTVIQETSVVQKHICRLAQNNSLAK
jgi:hypothetical protein